MAIKTDIELLSAANTIKNETTRNKNTATRVGQMFVDVIESKLNNDKQSILKVDDPIAAKATGVIEKDINNYLSLAAIEYGVNGNDIKIKSRILPMYDQGGNFIITMPDCDFHNNGIPDISITGENRADIQVTASETAIIILIPNTGSVKVSELVNALNSNTDFTNNYVVNLTAGKEDELVSEAYYVYMDSTLGVEVDGNDILVSYATSSGVMQDLALGSLQTVLGSVSEIIDVSLTGAGNIVGLFDDVTLSGGKDGVAVNKGTMVLDVIKNKLYIALDDTTEDSIDNWGYINITDYTENGSGE